MSNKVIVSRHPAAVEFIRQEMPEFADARIVESALVADIYGDVVAGNLPLHLAQYASAVLAIEFKGSPPRGAEYTIEDMRAAGAHLVSYVVFRSDKNERATNALMNDGFNSDISAVKCGELSLPNRCEGNELQ